jgi:biopolymer transport protein TolR
MAMGFASSGRRGRRGSGRRAPMAEINVTPLVDVMLVLLIIFMVTAPLLTSGVPLDLPDSRANAIEPDPNEVTVAVTKDGAIYLDDEPVEPGTLGVRLDSVLREAGGEPPLVTLRADTTLEYGRVVAVMGEINRAGFKSISLVNIHSETSP